MTRSLNWLWLPALLLLSGCGGRFTDADDSLPRNGKVVVRRVLRNYFVEDPSTCGCQYIYGLNDSCVAYFDTTKIKRLFPFVTNVDSFVLKYAPNFALSSLEYFRNVVEQGLTKDKSDKYYFSRVYAHGHPEIFQLHEQIKEGFFIDSKTPFSQDSTKKYGTKYLDWYHAFELEEEITFKDGRPTDRKLLSFSWGHDGKDGARIVWLGSVKGSEIERISRLMDMDSTNIYINYLTKHKSYWPLRWFRAEYPNASASPFSLMCNPSVFSEYTHINGKPFRSREESLSWLMRPDNPLCPAAPPKNKGYLVARYRLLDLIDDYPDYKTDEARDRLIKGLFGEEYAYKDYKANIERMHGYKAYLRRWAVGRLNDPNEMFFKTDPLDKRMTQADLRSELQKRYEKPVAGFTPELFDGGNNSMDLITVYEVQNGRRQVSIDYPTYLVLYSHTVTIDEPVVALKLPFYVLKDFPSYPGLHVADDTPKVLINLSGSTPMTVAQAVFIQQALAKPMLK